MNKAQILKVVSQKTTDLMALFKRAFEEELERVTIPNMVKLEMQKHLEFYRAEFMKIHQKGLDEVIDLMRKAQPPDQAEFNKYMAQAQVDLFRKAGMYEEAETISQKLLGMPSRPVLRETKLVQRGQLKKKLRKLRR
jgi:hypothetical protein